MKTKFETRDANVAETLREEPNLRRGQGLNISKTLYSVLEYRIS